MKARILALLACSASLLAALGAVERSPGPAQVPQTPPDIIATFSIAAVDPENGVSGAAVASKYPAVGKVVAHARAGQTLILTSTSYVGTTKDLLIDPLIARGFTPGVDIFTSNYGSFLPDWKPAGC